MSEGARARVVSRVPGRVRLRLAPGAPAPAGLESLADALAGVAGVVTIDVRPATRSLIVHHEGAWEALAADFAQIGLAIAELEPEETDPVRVVEALEGLESRFGALTGGRLDLAGAGVLALVAGGLVQAARGQIAGPALTLFGQAVTLAMMRAARPRR